VDALLDPPSDGLTVGAARVYVEDAEQRRLVLVLDPVCYLTGTAPELARRGVGLARELGGATLEVAGPLGSSDVLAALRAELPGCTVRPTGSTWLLTASLETASL
jgi:hypothetical protein